MPRPRCSLIFTFIKFSLVYSCSAHYINVSMRTPECYTRRPWQAYVDASQCRDAIGQISRMCDEKQHGADRWTFSMNPWQMHDPIILPISATVGNCFVGLDMGLYRYWSGEAIEVERKMHSIWRMCIAREPKPYGGIFAFRRLIFSSKPTGHSPSRRCAVFLSFSRLPIYAHAAGSPSIHEAALMM